MARNSQLALEVDEEVAIGDDWSRSIRFLNGTAGLHIADETFTAEVIDKDGETLLTLAKATSSHEDDDPGVESVLTVSTLDVALPVSVLSRWVVRTSTLGDRGLVGGAFFVRPKGAVQRGQSPVTPTVNLGGGITLTLDVGSVGASGASAYQVAVAGGFVGDEAAWLASLAGQDGEDGASGRAIVSATEPVDPPPAEGDFWIDSDDLALYGYYDGVWVALGGPSGTDGADGDAATAAHVADTTDAHDASAISVVDAGELFDATDVEAALAEVKAIADAAGSGSGITVVFVPASEFFGTTNAALSATNATGGNIPHRVLIDGAGNIASALTQLPPDWATFDVDFLVYNKSAAAGAWATNHKVTSVAVGESVDGFTAGTTLVTGTGTVTAGAEDIMEAISVGTDLAATAGEFIFLYVRRDGAVAGDTLAGEIGFIGARLTKAS